MWTAFPSSDYYDPSAPPRRHQPATGLPADQLAAGRGGGQRDGSHVHSRTVRRVRRPTMPLRLRHEYAAGFPRGLLAGDINRPRSSPHHDAGARRCPADPSGCSWWFALERRSYAGSPSLHLPVLLAGPGPSDGAGPSRLCQGCLPPSPTSLGSGCPQLRQPAATGWRRCPFITARFGAPRGARCPSSNTGSASWPGAPAGPGEDGWPGPGDRGPHRGPAGCGYIVGIEHR